MFGAATTSKDPGTLSCLHGALTGVASGRLSDDLDLHLKNVKSQVVPPNVKG